MFFKIFVDAKRYIVLFGLCVSTSAFHVKDEGVQRFQGDKSYLGEKSMRVYATEPLHAKIFIEFVALIIRNKADI